MNPRFGLSDFLRNGWLLMGSNMAQALIGLVSQLVLMRYLDPADFGQFAVSLASIGLIQVILSPRLNIVACRADSTEYTPEFRLRLYSAMTIESLASLAIMLIVLTALDQMGAWTLVLCLTLALAHWLNSVITFYERDLPYRGIAAVETFAQFMAHSLAVVFALAGLGVAALFLREVVIVSLRTFLAWRMGMLPRGPIRWVAGSEWRSLLIQARTPWLDGIADGLFQRLLVLMANTLGGLHGAGLFFQAQRLAMLPHQILSPVVVRLAGNLFARMEEPTLRRRVLTQVVGLVSLPLAAASVLALVFSDPLVPLVFGPKWSEAGHVLAAMAGTIFAFSLFELARGYCLAQRLNPLLMLGRLTQYAVLALGFVIIGDHGTAWSLGMVLSATTMLSTLVLLGGLGLISRE